MQSAKDVKAEEGDEGQETKYKRKRGKKIFFFCYHDRQQSPRSY